MSTGEDTNGNDSRNTSNNKFEGENLVKSANGHVHTTKSGKNWNSLPSPFFRTRGANIFSKKVGPKATVGTEIEVFELFFLETIYTTTLQYTNKHSRL